MAKKNTYDKISPQTQDDAIKAAKATQRPGQTKEQTKLIAQGIQKGIDYYKKQQKVKSRELNKKLNKVSQKFEHSGSEHDIPSKNNDTIVYKKSVLPWVLLFASWIGFAIYIVSLSSTLSDY